MVEFSHKLRHKQSEVRASMRDRVQAQPAVTSPPLMANRKVCFSFAAYACTVISHLSKCNIPISHGLSDEECQQIQSKFGFEFPPDLRSILQEGLPVGVGFPNWRSSSDKQLLSMINLPAKGLCREVAKGTFWCKQWGPRPGCINDAVCIARKAFNMAPVLVPIYSHCYIPCFPHMSGNPVLFVFEKDVFYCGYDLADFFEREVFIPLRSSSKIVRMQEWPDEAVPGAATLKRSEKQQITNSIYEEFATESKLNSCHGNEGNLISHEHIYDAHCNSQNQSPWHYNANDKARDQRDHSNHPHHPSARQLNWEMLNQRLLAELQNADVNDQWSHSREGICARHNEVISRKSVSEEPLHPSERPPESLIRSADNSPRMGRHIMSRYTYFHEKPLPAKVLAQFTIASPPWAAKMARHIPLWSELVENKENYFPDSNMAPGDAVENKKIRKWDLNVVQSKEKPWDSHTTQSTDSLNDVHAVQGKESFLHYGHEEAQSAQIASGKPGRRWLVPQLKDMEKRLRRGGWKEDDIEEIMVAVLPPNAEFLLHQETRGEIREALETSARVMSLLLQKAGWSGPDVSEILGLDLKRPKHMHMG